MKLKNILIEKMEREEQSSQLQKREDTAISSQDINKILETRNFFDIAMFYVEHNIKVFPVKRQDKMPLCAGGFKSATTDLEQLQEWNRKFPDCNIGIPTGHINGIFVVDVDGEQGLHSLAQLEQLHGKLFAPTVITGKGKHLYFKMPIDIEIKCNASKIADHIDIRANGGYVVAPPSIHSNGNKYKWENFDFSQDFPQAPEWLLNLVVNPDEAQNQINELLEEISNTPEGVRNSTLLKNAEKINYIANKSFKSTEEIKKDIISAGLESGLPKNEVEKTTDNALTYSDKQISFDIDPDIDILKTKKLLPAPQLNTKIFGNLEDWIIKTAESTNAPVDYVAFSLLAGAAGVVGLSRSISPWKNWVEPCSLWIGTVGEPSSHKSPAVRPVREILNKIEDERKKLYDLKIFEWKTKKEKAKQKKKEWEDKVKEDPDNAPPFPNDAVIPPKPCTYHFVYGDTTQEAVIQEMQNNILGGIVFRDELTGFFCGMNRYSSGQAEKSFWLEAFNGGKYTTSRVKFEGERIEIKNLLMSTFGTIQPQRLIETVLSDRGDGFLARFLWVYPEPIRASIPQNETLPSTALRAFQNLNSLLNPYKENAEEQKKCLPLSEEAQEIFNTWYINHDEKSQQEESILKHFLGKGQGYVLRLALVLELLWWASEEYLEPNEISLEAIKAAIELFDNYLTPMCERVYNMYYSPSQNIEARALAKWILNSRPQYFIMRDIYHNGTIRELNCMDKVKKAVTTLCSLGWLSEYKSREGTTKGRQKATYYVNPEVYELAKDL